MLEERLDFNNYENNSEIENEDDMIIDDESLFSKAVLWSTDWTTETIISQLNKGNIELDPSFQRRDAWGNERKSSFIESIILGLPIPQIILAERANQKGSYIVIDGKQRLLSIRQFCSKNKGNLFDPLKLKQLKVLKTLEGKTYENISSDSKLSSHITSFENQSIRTIIIKNWPNQDFLYTVFLRLNTGSLPLSPQELRQALMPGEFTKFADDFSINSEFVKKVLNLRKPDYRMRDVEIVIRFFAFYNFIRDYRGNLKYFLDSTCEKLNNIWLESSDDIKAQANQLDEAIKFTYSIFDKNAFSKYSKGDFTNSFNRPVYDIMTFYFSKPDIRNTSENFKIQIFNSFKDLCENNIDFLRSLETSTKNLESTSNRFYLWGVELKKILNINFEIPKRGEIGMIVED